MAIARETVSAASPAKKERPAKVEYPHISVDQACVLACDEARVKQELFDLANEWARQSQSTGAKVGLLKGASICKTLNDVLPDAIEKMEQQLEFLKNNYDRYADMEADDGELMKALHECDQFLLSIAYAAKDGWRASKMFQQFTGHTFEDVDVADKLRNTIKAAKKKGLTKEEIMKLLEED